MNQSRQAISWADGVFLMFVSAWAVATPILYLFVYNFFASPYLPSWARLPLGVIFSMVNESGITLMPLCGLSALYGILWIAGLGSFAIGAVLAACGWGLWRRKTWATYLLFGIAAWNVIVLSIYLIRLGIPDMLKYRMINTSYQALLLTLGYYSSVVVRFALWKIRCRLPGT